MILAETLPDPNHYASIGWLLVSIAAIAYGANHIWELVNRMRGEPPHPPNSLLEADHRALKHRVKNLEEWRDGLAQKLDRDKREILDAGDRREIKITTELDELRRAQAQTNRTVAAIPNEFMALLANAKNILGDKH